MLTEEILDVWVMNNYLAIEKTGGEVFVLPKRWFVERAERSLDFNNVRLTQDRLLVGGHEFSFAEVINAKS